MTLEEIRSAIMNELSSSWATATAVAWPNQKFNEPNDIWIRPTVRMGETVYGEIGEDGVGLRSGVLMIQVFDLANNGIKTSLDYAARLETLFRRQDLSGVLFGESSTDVIGLDSENGYWQTLVSVSFTTWIGE
ncbi:MAG: phage tail terminator-like protein [Sulfuricurvum sp.]|jgi:hypothetical protein|nr:phage tail terminator-like protein [Sulfuricurvum sp.]